MNRQSWIKRLLSRKTIEATDPQPTTHGPGSAGRGSSTETDASSHEPPPHMPNLLALSAPPSAVAPFPTGDAEAAVPAVWHIGDIILDPYEVKGVLGEGGMGIVYCVHHRGWNTDLAVKSPRPEIFAKTGGKERFIREAETWVKLGLHPHIVSCYYVRTLGGIPRVFAEYVASGSLSEWIRTRRLYEGGHEQALERILDVAIQFAWGLDFAHEQGLVHQDVKPANVMMTADDIAKVTDFGLAKARAMAGEIRILGGGQSILVSRQGMTPAYCSPEQASGGHVSRKTDIWSWGVSVLEMFVGEVTWMSGIVAQEALASYKGQDPAIPLMPAEVVKLLGRCFEPRPEDRPATMLEVATELQAIYARLVEHSYAREAPHPAELLADGLNNRALSLFDLGKIEEAKQVWEQALQIDPQYLEATYNQGIILWRRAELTDDVLVQQLETARAAQGDPWQAMYLLALVQRERGDEGAALSLLLSAAQRAPGETEVQKLLKQIRPSTIPPGRCLHTSKVGGTPVWLSADGRWALSSSHFGQQFWEVATDHCLGTFQGDIDWPWSANLSADGRWVITGLGDGTVRLWEVATGRCVRTFREHKSIAPYGPMVGSVYLSADGQWALSGGYDKTVRLWKTHKRRSVAILQGHTSAVTSVVLSANRQWALSGSFDGTARLWEATTGYCLHVFQCDTAGVTSVALSANGQWALSGSAEGAIQLWEVATGRCLRSFQGHTSRVESLCLNADDQWILSGSDDGTARLWEVATGRCIYTFLGHTEKVSSVALSTDGRWAFSGSNDETIRIWEMPHERFRAPLRVSQGRSYAEVSPVEIQAQGLLQQARAALRNAQFAAALDLANRVRALSGWERSPKSLEVWTRLLLHCRKVSLHTEWFIRTFRGHTERVSSLSLSADGQWVLSGSDDKTMRLWEVATGRCLHIFQGHTDAVYSVRLSADSRHAFSGSADGIQLWEVSTGRCLRSFQGHTSKSLCLSADNRWILSGGSGQSVRLWEVATGHCLRTFEGHTDEVYSVSLSADGRLALSGGRDQTVRLWEVATGLCLHIFRSGGSDIVTSVSLSVNGRWAVAGIVHPGGVYQSIRLWNTVTGIEWSPDSFGLRPPLPGNGAKSVPGIKWSPDSFSLRGPGYPQVKSVSLSADNRWILSGGSDQSVRLWDVTTGRCTHTFTPSEYAGGVNAVSLSSDGRWVLSGSDDGGIRLWELDWELEAHDSVDWDQGALPTLETFLNLHTPYAEQEIQQALTRRGKPSWSEQDFQGLIRQLQYAGYGWLRPEGVRRTLEEMATSWQGPPPLTSTP